jgi:hypothetical protein
LTWKATGQKRAKQTRDGEEVEDRIYNQKDFDRRLDDDGCEIISKQNQNREIPVINGEISGAGHKVSLSERLESRRTSVHRNSSADTSKIGRFSLTYEATAVKGLIDERDIAR